MRIIRPFLFALQFLTRIPLAPSGAPSAADLRWATAFYSTVGLVIGVSAAAVYRLSVSFLPASVSVVLVLLFSVLLTGALHEDGLADCADAFAGAHDRDRVLEIMRDSRIGAFGALAIAFALLLKVTLLSSLPEDQLVQSLVIAPVLGRWLVLPLTRFSRAARSNGLGSAFASHVEGPQIVIAAVPVLVVGIFLYGGLFPIVAAGPVIAVTLWGWYCRRRIGGLTGDCLGAAIQFSEITTLLTLVALEQS